ncbi:MAG: hypothetical protein CMN73_02680 [Sphingomonas sp.]|nr:hypothetical protein [Sphingomonas sp.]|tara:strand:- start:1583 stop:2101 length:519 start_codon:yes stop_codon:yes gene_type:complete
MQLARLAVLVKWLDASSIAPRSPMGDTVTMGRWAEIIPVAFDELPPTDFDPMALSLFVSIEQTVGLSFPDVADVGFPVGQLRPAARLEHLRLKVEDAAMALPSPWRSQNDTLPPMAIVGITDPEMTPQDAVDAAGASEIDLDTFPVIVAPTWAFSAKERAEIEARFPFLPLR